MDKVRYILASASPRRHELLKKVVGKFSVITADVEEFSQYVRPHLFVQELAERKCMAVAALTKRDSDISNNEYNSTVIIAADTLVVHKGKILGKPASKKQAFKMLRTLQNS